MWYQSYATVPDPDGIDTFIRSLHLYAESDDGLAWSKPALGTTEDSTRFGREQHRLCQTGVQQRDQPVRAA